MDTKNVRGEAVSSGEYWVRWYVWAASTGLEQRKDGKKLGQRKRNK